MVVGEIFKKVREGGGWGGGVEKGREFGGCLGCGGKILRK